MPTGSPRTRILYIVVLLLLALQIGCKNRTSPKPAPPKGMVHVPAGEFIMGSDETDKEAKALQYGSTRQWYVNEHPARKESIDGFYIDKFEVTNREYKEFVDATGHRPPPLWRGETYPAELADHPVVAVDWYDAEAYCKHRGKTLPSEAQWEKAARGSDGRSFPWGSEFDSKKLNTFGDYGGTTPVGKFPDGASPYGALDMAGNVQEWTSGWYKAYPGNKFSDPDYGEKLKVIRGGGWGGIGHYTLSYFVRSTFRHGIDPKGRFDDVGFRCVRAD